MRTWLVAALSVGLATMVACGAFSAADTAPVMDPRAGDGGDGGDGGGVGDGAAASPPEAASDAGLLTGGDFEGMRPCSGWTPARASIDVSTDQPHSGARACLLCENDSATDTPVELYLDPPPEVEIVSPAKSSFYRAEVWVRLVPVSETADDAQAQLRFSRDHDAELSSSSFVGLTSTWQRLTWQYTVREDTKSLRVGLHFTTQKKTCVAIDDFVLRSID